MSTPTAPKKVLTQQQSIIVMSLGGIMLALAIFVPVEPGSTAQTIKFLVGTLGFCILGAGSYFRPMKPTTEQPAK